MMVLMNVDLPEPEWPTRNTKSPGMMSSEMSSRAGLSGWAGYTSDTWRMAMVGGTLPYPGCCWEAARWAPVTPGAAAGAACAGAAFPKWLATGELQS